jgi:hypothetical protein
MGYTDLDQLAINTIRVLAVSPGTQQNPLPHPRCYESAASSVVAGHVCAFGTSSSDAVEPGMAFLGRNG